MVLSDFSKVTQLLQGRSGLESRLSDFKIFFSLQPFYHPALKHNLINSGIKCFQHYLFLVIQKISKMISSLVYEFCLILNIDTLSNFQSRNQRTCPIFWTYVQRTYSRDTDFCFEISRALWPHTGINFWKHYTSACKECVFSCY